MVGAPSVATSTLPSYRLSLVRVDDGGAEPWLAEVDGLPHCSTRAATPEDAARRALAAVDELVGQVPGEEGEPSSPRHSGRLLVRMPATLHDELARAAKQEGVSLNQLITGFLAGAVGWRSTEASLHGSADAPEGPSSRRLDRVVLAANFAVVSLVAVVAVALLLLAWRG